LQNREFKLQRHTRSAGARSNLERSQDLLVVADTERKFLNVNPAWTATLGWSEADLVGKTSQWLRHPNDG
jgi:PAS domain S-box-containing protein